VINRRSLLESVIFSGVLSACVSPRTALSGRKRTSLAGALLQVQAVHTEAEVIDRLGPPNGAAIFDPGNEAESTNMMNRFPRRKWPDSYLSVPPTLLETLPARSRLIYYWFDYGNHVAGDFDIAIDGQGRVLGWFYSKALEGAENQAGLIDHN